MLTAKQKLKNQYQFETFCKDVIVKERKDFDKSVRNRSKKEFTFSELPSYVPETFRSKDLYPGECYIFVVKGIRVPIRNDRLADALFSFTAEECSILLLHYALEFTDEDIAAFFGRPRSTINYRKNQLFKILLQKMKEE